MSARHLTRNRPKPRQRKGKPSSEVIGLALMLTRAEIQKLKALAAAGPLLGGQLCGLANRAVAESADPEANGRIGAGCASG